MTRLTLALAAVLLLAGCSKGDAPPAQGGSGSAETAPEAAEERISCALAGAAEFVPDCLIERSQSNGDDLVIVRHPDGGFRRFALIDKGTRIATADGVEEVKAELKGGFLEVKVADDRYRFPSAPPAPEQTSQAADAQPAAR